MSEDYYKTLGINRDASESEIQKAYRALAQKYHPDLNPNNKNAKTKFQEVQNAFDILNDPNKRELYDRYGSSFETMAGGSHANATWNTARPHAGFEEMDLGELFGQRFEGSGKGGFADIFKQFTRGQHTTQRRRTPRQGADIQHDLTIPFKTAVTGGEANLSIQRADGKRENITVKIPAGIEDGKKIRLRGQGERPSTGPAGDILITVQVQPHSCFERRGNNLEVKVPVTLAEAALGGTVDIPTPRGIISLKVPPACSSGTRLRVKGHGIDGQGNDCGDLYAEIQIILPKSLSDEDQEMIRQIALRQRIDPRNDLTW